MKLLKSLLRMARPLHLMLAALTYALGAGIARYLGSPIRPGPLILGLVVALLMQAAMSLLAALFLSGTDAPQGAEGDQQRELVRSAALHTSVAALAAAVLLVFALHRNQGISTGALVCIGTSMLLIVVYAVPPARVLDRGLGELLLAAQVAYVTPSLGFSLQADGYHRLLTACILALTLLLVATLMALGLPSYAEDVRRERSTLLTRMGWENALRVHHLLVIAAYLLLGSAALLGFAFELFLPAFLTVPFALLQGLLLRNMARGAKPLWNLINANAIAIFGLTTYFLTLSFWLR